MSISWAQGLLAGAAGVAEYSAQEQARRQKRLDRTNELQNNMRLTHAKSRYASKISAYEKNKMQLDSLKGVEAGSYEEQFLLYKAKGLDSSSASVLASKGIAEGKRIPRPEALEMPQLLIPSMVQGRARSPIGDWAANYSNTVRPETPKEITDRHKDIAPLDTTGLGQPQDPGISRDVSTGAAPTVESLGSVTSKPASFEPQPGFEDPLNPSQAPDQVRVEGFDVEGKPVVTFYDRHFNQETKKNELIPTQTVAKGSKADTDLTNKNKTKETKGGRITTSEIDSFIREDGQFDSIFHPLNEQFTGTFFTDTDDPRDYDQIKQAVSSTYLTTLKNLTASASAEDVIAFGTDMEREAQGVALLRNLDPRDIAKMLDEDGDEKLDIRVFKGSHATQTSDIIKNLESLGNKQAVKELEFYMIEALQQTPPEIERVQVAF